MKNNLFFSKYKFIGIMAIILLLQVITAFYFCTQKQGFHYDEYYSYYSSNVTYGLVPSDGEWKSTDEIKSEFMVMPDAGFSYKMVSLMQSYDVHPPFYYFVLHTVCSLTPGVFSKWQGLSINLVFFVLSFLLLAKIISLLTNKNEKAVAAVCLLYGFSPAVLSGITFIRMYMMLTFFCLLFMYIHCKAIIQDKKTLLGFYIPVIITTYLGFLTHYYFAVFLFFVGIVTFFSMVFIKKTRKHATCYAASIVVGLLLAVMTFPSCLSHMFRGYRGTEATQAFFDMGNIRLRLSFFFNLINEYVFSNFFYVLLLIVFVLYLTDRYIKKKNKIKNSDWKQSPKKRIYLLVFMTIIGYFLVVAKTALLNAEEAIRYEMPIYGLVILWILVSLLYFLTNIGKEGSLKIRMIAFEVIVLATFALQIIGLANNKVLFLYEKDKENNAWAAQNSTATVAYLYHDVNQWMIWDDSEELMQYEKIYFTNLSHTDIDDAELQHAEKMYVYAVRDDLTEATLEQLIDQNDNLNQYEKIRELQYCDLYELK